MIFEIIDKKQECTNIVSDGKIISKPNYENLTKTWDYHPSLNNSNIEYAYLYAQGKSLDECCPEHLRDEWQRVKDIHKAFIKSFTVAKVEAENHCFYDLVPSSFVIDYFSTKSKITEHVISNNERPKNYDFMLELLKLIKNISSRKLNIKKEEMIPLVHEVPALNFYKKIGKVTPFVKYNMFGTITGRLTTRRDSFPLLTMNKKWRSVIAPNNDWLVELDFNAAELRCMLALNDKEQPLDDVHEWHGKIFNNLLDKDLSRDEIKGKIFSWLYGPLGISLGIPEVEKLYSKRNILNKYWDGSKVINYFGRMIESDEFHALNAILQSTTSDAFLRRAVDVNNKLVGKKSYIMGLVHDSLIIDFSRDDKDSLNEIVSLFGDTELGKFKVNVSVGTNFGNMKKLR